MLPLVIPWSTAASLFDAIFEPNGVLNAVLACVFGVHHPPQYFADPAYSFAMVIWLGVWKGAPWCYLLLLGALAAIPPEMLESARLDGARGVSFWTRIVLPSIRPMFVFVIIFRVLAEAQTFTSVSLLTGGGPFGSTELVSLYGYNLAFQDFVWGVAAAAGSLVGAALLVTAMAGVGLMEARPGKAAWKMLDSARETLFPPRTRGRGAVGHRSGRPGAICVRGRFLGARRWWPFSRRPVARRSGLVVVCLLVVLALLPLIGELPAWRHIFNNPLPWSAVSGPLFNSTVVTLATVAGTVLLAVPGAYVLARSRLRFRRFLTFVVLVCLAIPGIVLILPQYLEMARLGLVNSLLGLVLLYVAAGLPLAIFFLRPAFAAVPAELAESMRVDGATTPRIVGTLVLPLASSAIVAVSVLVAVQAWNEVTLAATLLNSSQLYTLPVLGAVQFGTTVPISAGWITYVPPLLVFIACQRWFRRGLTRTKLLL